MDSYTDKPQVFLVSEVYHQAFENELNKKLNELWKKEKTIHEIKTFANGDYVFATIIYS